MYLLFITDIFADEESEFPAFDIVNNQFSFLGTCSELDITKVERFANPVRLCVNFLPILSSISK